MSGSFKEFVLEEGPFWSSLVHGVKTGVKAYHQKRAEPLKKEQRRPGLRSMTAKIMDAEGEELKDLVKQIVDNGYRIQGGDIRKDDGRRHSTEWLNEDVHAQRRNQAKKS